MSNISDGRFKGKLDSELELQNVGQGIRVNDLKINTSCGDGRSEYSCHHPSSSSKGAKRGMGGSVLRPFYYLLLRSRTCLYPVW
ncbi:jg1919 [Pararge aegeria aegeria]|uniref:Jg1919 protein n=1 Tax=Pararge aegeria aegeria TaxID=348720 RepID=A0A8S4R488_9NEOP|nr:jg1919 [Pararge aegeria aegeria]